MRLHMLILLAVFLVPGFSRAQEPPQRCFSNCKKQFAFVRDLDGAVSDPRLQSVFGPPSGHIRGNVSDGISYKGTDSTIIVLKKVMANKPDATSKPYAYGIFLTGDPDNVPVSRRLIGAAKAPTLSTLSFSDLASKCPGKVEITPKFSQAITPSCFKTSDGGGGKIAFMFPAAECDEGSDGAEDEMTMLEILEQNCNRTANPFGFIIELDDGDAQTSGSQFHDYIVFKSLD
jgi:hypothetical protein